MIKLQTEVEVGRSRVEISYRDRILVLGSCFADNVGEKMVQAGFDACVNPFGTLYNPASIEAAVRRLSSGEPFTEQECVQMGAGAGLVCSFSHHTSFARPTAGEFLRDANARLKEASEFFAACNKVIITLGTAWYFTYNETGAVVSNCLKRLPSEFTRRMMDVPEASGILRSIIDSCPGKEFIFTVSPVRHMADTAHGNQLSKSTLLLAVDAVKGESAEYFPSYEIVLDELRDYRFYAEDMVHPSAQTVAYIWSRFCDFALARGEKEELLAREKLFKRSQHRLLH